MLTLGGLVGVILTRERSKWLRVFAVACCACGSILLFAKPFLPKPKTSANHLQVQEEIGSRIGTQIRESGMEPGEVLLVAWPEIDSGMIRMASSMEAGLRRGLGKAFPVKRFPVEDWSHHNRERLLGGVPGNDWAALASSLPETHIIVSMIGHPAGRIEGLFTRCKALYIDDTLVMSFRRQATQHVDPDAPFKGYTSYRSKKAGTSPLESIRWNSPHKK